MDPDHAPPAPPPSQTPGRIRLRLPRVPAVIGVVVVSAFLAVGGWLQRRDATRDDAAVAVVRSAVAERQARADDYRARFQALQWRADKIRAWAEAQASEPVRSWARGRARLFDALVNRCDRRDDMAALAAAARDIERRCAEGDLAAAQARASALPAIDFPVPADFLQRQRETYLEPLARLSRQNPECYRMFQQQEPEAAREDIARLRQELDQAEADAVTPQLMVKVDLLGAVAPANDPVLAEWTALAAAGDFFDHPDGETLAHWRRARRALRREEWQTAVAEMQSILRLTVRTRQPFRAAYGRALLRNRPDQPDAAYPFFQEAAAAGDAEARAWMAEQDLAQGRLAQALRWLEAGVMAGDPAATAPVLDIYMRDDVPRDAVREAGVLHKILLTPDAPPNAGLLLARLYEEGRGVPRSAEQAFALYAQVAERGHVPAWPEVARCHLRGLGTPADPEQAADWACRAYEAGEREKALPILIELLQREPGRAAGRVQVMIEHETTIAKEGFQDVRRFALGMDQMRLLLARHFDRSGQFGQAARYYAGAGTSQGDAARRLAELTESHVCDTCGGSGRIRASAPCPTCGGKGTVLCSHCNGLGYTYEPGAPPCTVCDGRGAVLQDGKTVTCAACGGTGKGKGSAMKKTCTFCVNGRMTCPDCTNGRIFILKECPDCRGAGHWTLAGKGGG